MGTKHCRECELDIPCGKFHVYVIELDQEILSEKRFRDKNPEPPMDNSLPCYYVGYTNHTPRCRFTQHQESVGQTGPVKHRCDCMNPGNIKERNGWGHQFAEYNKWLKGRMFKINNPFETQDEAKKKEIWLADELRKKGHGVWQN